MPQLTFAGSTLRLSWLRLKARGRLVARPQVRVGRGVTITAAPGARILLEDGCILGDGARIEANAGTIRIGAAARLGERSVLVALAGIDVGAGCVVGDWALVSDAEPSFEDPERPIREQPLRAAPVTLGDGARIGPHAKVLAGAAIPPGAVVEPYAVVTESRSSA
jgi:acetyltransferase-like isoleucine patch superfamily enzyme